MSIIHQAIKKQQSMFVSLLTSTSDAWPGNIHVITKALTMQCETMINRPTQWDESYR